MRLDKRRLNAGCIYAGIIVAVAALGACRSETPGAGSGDTTPAAARADSPSTPPPSPNAMPTVRSDSVLVKTDKAQYTAGEQIALTFENKSAAGFTFNPCTRTVEQEQGGTWTPISEPDRMCTMQAYILEPRGSRTDTTDLPTPLPAGRYRVVVRMTMDSPGATSSSAITAVSDPITVP